MHRILRGRQPPAAPSGHDPTHWDGSSIHLLYWDTLALTQETITLVPGRESSGLVRTGALDAARSYTDHR